MPEPIVMELEVKQGDEKVFGMCGDKVQVTDDPEVMGRVCRILAEALNSALTWALKA